MLITRPVSLSWGGVIVVGPGSWHKRKSKACQVIWRSSWPSLGARVDRPRLWKGASEFLSGCHGGGRSLYAVALLTAPSMMACSLRSHVLLNVPGIFIQR